MYKVSHYAEKDRGKMIAFAKERSFAVVIGSSDNFPAATQLPLEIIEEGDKIYLAGHIMRKTDHHIAFEKHPKLLVIFTSPHAYIKADWYENPKVGSTVNYMAVHAKGTIYFTDEAGTRDAVKRITDQRVGIEGPASFDKLSEEYIQAMVKAIVGFRIAIDSMEAVFVLSQNKRLPTVKISLLI